MFPPEKQAGGLGKPLLLRAFGVALMLACSGRKVVQEEQAVSSVRGPPLDPQGPQWTPVAPRLLREPTEQAPADLAAMRRTYGPADMKLSDCTKVGAEGTITGAHCPNGCVVFGPYVSAPPESNVRVSFELRARDPLEFSSDMITDGRLTRGRVDAQRLAAGEVRKLSYEVYLPDAALSLEARVWISADKPAAFEIKNWGVRVQ